jgi:hypothetical protein
VSEFFITARSFAAPFVSDESEKYVEAATPSEALESFAATYSHPCGLYAAEAWKNADAYHKSKEPLARWLSNHARAMHEATAGLSGYSVLGHGPGNFEVNGKRIRIDDPAQGSVVS